MKSKRITLSLSIIVITLGVLCGAGCSQQQTTTKTIIPDRLEIATSIPERFLVQYYVVKQQRDVPRYMDDSLRVLYDEWGHKNAENGWFGVVASEPLSHSPGFAWTIAVIPDFEKELSMSCRAAYLVRNIDSKKFISPIERMAVLYQPDDKTQHIYGWKIAVPETKSGDNILLVMSITGKAQIPADAKRILYTKVN